MANLPDESWFSKWMRNGRLSALLFVLILVIYVGFKIAKIEAPIIDQLLITMSGILVGNLALKKPGEEKKAAPADEKEKEKEVKPDE